MPTSMQLAEEKLTGFPRALRDAGMLVDSARIVNYLEALTSLGIRSFAHLALVGRIVFVSSKEDRVVYDRVFNAWFGDTSGFVMDPDGDGEEVPLREKPNQKQAGLPDIVAGDTKGKQASTDEAIGSKTFETIDGSSVDQLRKIGKIALRLPTRTERKWKAARNGRRIDLAGTCAQARHSFGETLRLARLALPQKPRKVLLLIDVSGSMQTASQPGLKMAHAMVHARPDVEVFCLGTRLTRVTECLRQPDVESALNSLGRKVLDFDGGTRLGQGLSDFLSVNSHAALVRGALTIVISDGLERGDHGLMVKAVERLGRLSHRLVWLTPLASDPRYVPKTRALAACMPFIDMLGSAGSLDSLARSLADMTNVDRLPRGQATRLFERKRQIL